MLSDTNAETYQVEQRTQTYLSRQSLFEGIYRGYINRMKTYSRAGKLLDVGCNIGLFLKVAREEGFDVTGVELNRDCAAYGRENFGLEIHSEYLDAIGFPSGSFEVVTLFDVLEHIPDLHNFLKEVRRIIRPGGLLVVQSPNLGSLMAELTGSQWSWLTPPDHLYHFTPETLQLLLHESGFTVKECRTWEPAGEFALNLLRVYKANSLMVKILFGLNRMTGIVDMLTAVVQRLWWRKMRGGLLQFYAVKSEGG
jgi:SAM-dependent methyltransferase